MFFTEGPLTLSSLRRAAAAGTREIPKVAGKDLATPRAIRKLVKPSCRAAKPSHHDSGSEIVDIFERHGFIWGGKWYHYDTMHFEHRPELLSR